MNDVPPGLQLCPTRVDGVEALFAHAVTAPMCQQRQREHYHKCFTCVHNNARSSLRGPVVPAPNASAPQAPPARRISSAV